MMPTDVDILQPTPAKDNLVPEQPHWTGWSGYTFKGSPYCRISYAKISNPIFNHCSNKPCCCSASGYPPAGPGSPALVGPSRPTKSGYCHCVVPPPSTRGDLAATISLASRRPYSLLGSVYLGPLLAPPERRG